MESSGSCGERRSDVSKKETHEVHAAVIAFATSRHSEGMRKTRFSAPADLFGAAEFRRNRKDIRDAAFGVAWYDDTFFGG
jgi:hypothetical protein